MGPTGPSSSDLGVRLLAGFRLRCAVASLAAALPAERTGRDGTDETCGAATADAASHTRSPNASTSEDTARTEAPEVVALNRRKACSRSCVFGGVVAGRHRVDAVDAVADLPDDLGRLEFPQRDIYAGPIIALDNRQVNACIISV